MITIFTCPKPFRGKDAIQQENAVRSWLTLKPKPEIILIGDDEGVAEAAKKLGVISIPEVKRNKLGTPLVSSVFAIGRQKASFSTICYINADIILPPDFFTKLKLKEIYKFAGEKFLVFGGRQWDTKIDKPIDFTNPRWYDTLFEKAQKTGLRDGVMSKDYFIFPKSIDWQIPDFALGRMHWENWFPHRARKFGFPLINANPLISVLHQWHDYHYFQREDEFRGTTKEELMNIRLLGCGRHYMLSEATHILTEAGIEKANQSRIQFLILRMRSIKMWIASVFLRGILYPYSLPIYYVWIPLKKFWRSALRLLLGYTNSTPKCR